MLHFVVIINLFVCVTFASGFPIQQMMLIQPDFLSMSKNKYIDMILLFFF